MMVKIRSLAEEITQLAVHVRWVSANLLSLVWPRPPATPSPALAFIEPLLLLLERVPTDCSIFIPNRTPDTSCGGQLKGKTNPVIAFVAPSSPCFGVKKRIPPTGKEFKAWGLYNFSKAVMLHSVFIRWWQSEISYLFSPHPFIMM